MKTDISLSYLNGHKFTITVDKASLAKNRFNFSNDPVTTVGLLFDKLPVKNGLFGEKNISQTWSGWLVDGAYHSSLYSALVAATKSPSIKASKMYRFNYSSGTRAGQKRAVIVDEVDSVYVQARDLDTNNPKRYLLSRISELEEIA